MSSPTTQKPWLDYLRIIATLAVICIHATSHYYKNAPDLNTLNWWLTNLLNAASRFAVPIFVMISGALLLGKPSTTKAFYQKRTIRLLPPLLFWSAFYLGFGLLTDTDLHQQLWQILLHGYTRIHLWYLTMLACLMLFAPFINQFINGNKPRPADLHLLLLLMLGFFSLNGLALVAENLLKAELNWFRIFPWYIAYFILGYYLDHYGNRLHLSNRIIATALTLLIAAGAGGNYLLRQHLHISQDPPPLFSDMGPLSFIIAALVFLLAKTNAAYLRDHKTVRHLADTTFGIYLVHPVFIFLSKQALPDYNSHPLPYIALTFTATTLLSYLCIAVLRKNALFRRVT